MKIKFPFIFKGFTELLFGPGGNSAARFTEFAIRIALIVVIFELIFIFRVAKRAIELLVALTVLPTPALSAKFPFTKST